MRETPQVCPIQEFCKNYKNTDDFILSNMGLLMKGEDTDMEVSLCMTEDTLANSEGGNFRCAFRQLFFEARRRGLIEDLPGKDKLIEKMVEWGGKENLNH